MRPFKQAAILVVLSCTIWAQQEAVREAQVEPQKHSDLIVRVAGYSTYFTLLTPAEQNEIIKRTENQL